MPLNLSSLPYFDAKSLKEDLSNKTNRLKVGLMQVSTLNSQTSKSETFSTNFPITIIFFWGGGGGVVNGPVDPCDFFFLKSQITLSYPAHFKI